MYASAATAHRPDWALSVGASPAGYSTPTERLRAPWERTVALRVGSVLESVDPSALSPRDYAAYQTLRWWLDVNAEGAAFRNIDFSNLSPSRNGLIALLSSARTHPFKVADDTIGYLMVLRGIARWMDDLPTALDLQAQDSVRATADIVHAFREFVDLVRAANDGGAFRASAQRLTSIDAPTTAALRLSERTAQDSVARACARLLAYLSDYERSAPAQWGLWQYAGGKELYRYLLRRHTGVEITPDDAQRTALGELRRVDSLLSTLRTRAGSTRNDREYRDSLVRFFEMQAATADMAARRIVDSQGALQDTLLKALRIAQPAFSVAVRDEPLERALFPLGRVSLEDATDSAVTVVIQPVWWSIDALNEGRSFVYRSIWPGQLLPLATSAGSHSVLELIDVQATTAGWAEYAGSLAGELGMYAAVNDSYGRVMHEGWTAALLLVDTGIHYFGWSRAQALAALRPYSLADVDVLEEILVREVLQQPGSAGAAFLGRREFAAMRGWMRQALGPTFSVPEWHAAILSLGIVPLPVMASYLEWWSWDQQRRSAPVRMGRP